MPVLADLELRHLAALDAVCTEGTFGRAASRLGYTQSAVSQQIAALERIVGGSLFDRPGGPRPVTLTPLGKLVLDHARELLARVASAGDAVERFLAGDGGRLDVGTFQSVSNVLLPAIVAELRRTHPALDIRLFEDEHKEESTRKLLDGDLDLAFVVGGRSGDLESIVLLDDPFVLVAGRRQLRPGPFPTGDLGGRSLVGYPAGPCQQDVEDGLRVHGAVPTFVFRSNDNGALTAMVRAGMGWAVMPLLAVDPDDPTIDVRLLAPAIPPRQVCLAWRRARTMSSAASRLVEIAVDVARELRQLPTSA